MREWAGPRAKDSSELNLWPADWSTAVDQLKREPAGELAVTHRVAWQRSEAHFGDWCRLVKAVGHTRAFIDEAHDYGAHNSPHARELVELTRNARHESVELVFIAQRPTGIHPSIRSQAHAIVCFPMDEPGDLAALAGHCGTKFAKEVAAARGHTATVWRAGT